MTIDSPTRPQPTTHVAFAAFSNANFRIFWLCSSLAMMADNIEHVISYWIIYQKFHSPALGGFAVVSHWVPYLLFAGYTGAMADRFDIRRLIQIGMVIFMAVSVCWGAMFVSESVALWKAEALLVAHGLAGVIWLPAAQVMINQIAAPDELPSAVRLSATGRYLGFLVGPAVGAALLLAFGPAYGIFLNALIYAPFFLWLIAAPYGRAALNWRPAPQVAGFFDIWSTVKVIRRHPVLLTMTALVGAASFFVGNAYQAQMPGFAEGLGHGRADFSYSILLAADAAGGLAAGLLLESRGLLPPKTGTAVILAIVWACSLTAFALSGYYWLSIALLFVAGFVELSFNAMAQALVQLNAPAEIRGKVIGVFSMSAMGLRTFSGLSVGLLGVVLGIHLSLALSAAVSIVLFCVILTSIRSRASGWH